MKSAKDSSQMLAFDHSTVEEVERTLSQKGLECFRVHLELEFLAAAEPEKKKHASGQASSS